jgi:toxin-antitoxin system PIN domain toxin
MSYAIDANVLLYASDRSAPQHDSARRFLDRCAVNPEVLCVAWPTVMTYLRIATHAAIFSEPLTPAEALANITALLDLPQVRPVSETEGFLDAYAHVCGTTVVRGNLVPDAHVAAILFQHGVKTLFTNDRDFRKFNTLETRDPFASAT